MSRYTSGGVRQCSRTGCSDRATVTLTYQYSRSQVWLDELTDERDPHGYDMCPAHAGRLSAPQGWHVLDRRRPLATVTRLAG
jgi:Protein of unknown function (DUF3499)